MEWLYISLKWYAYLFIVGLIFFPITRKLFSKFADEGYGLSKTIGIIILSYVSFVLGVTHLLPFSQAYLFILGALFAFVSLFILVKDTQTKLPPKEISKSSHKHHKKAQKQPTISISFTLPARKKLIIFLVEEILFLGGLLFLAYVRGQEPSIRGLEKFMDFGFMNSVLRSNYFPPKDIWYSSDASHPAGYPINYYYFGHLSGALLIKLTGTSPFAGYNLVLATILAQGLSIVFSLVSTLINSVQHYVKQWSTKLVYLILYGILGAYIVNFAGNLHTIYLFTKGYPNETPVPFWQIFGGYHPEKYWYPNATRFIHNTIHEFPSYSYVVADLHGHVFDIPFVLLTLCVLFAFFLHIKLRTKVADSDIKKEFEGIRSAFIAEHSITTRIKKLFSQVVKTIRAHSNILFTVILGFLTSVHYMTNAFDGPIYVLLVAAYLFYFFKLTYRFFLHIGLLVISFIVFSMPFSMHFKPFVSGIALNCSPDFLTKIGKFGPFLFEAGKCQTSPLWMLGVLWGFFFVNFLMLLVIMYLTGKNKPEKSSSLLDITELDRFSLILFIVGLYLLLVPEFFYIKDIYPDHFRANTMFKLGYQAFIMMGVASTYVLYRIKFLVSRLRYLLKLIFLFLFFFIFLYPFYAFPSYYGDLKKPVELDGSVWLTTTYPEDKEIIDYLNNTVKGQPNILESQGDSYTDHERISAYTGLPTVAGWWVHEWLWRGTAEIIGDRIPDVVALYESQDIEQTKALLEKYNVKYVIVGSQEKEKYTNLNEDKFNVIGKKIFESSDKNGAIYQIK